MLDTILKTILDIIVVPIHRAGWAIIGVVAVISLVLIAVAPPLGLLGVVLTIWCVYFFRDPDRMVPIREGLIVSAADGIVQSVGPASSPPELGMSNKPLTRISVFLNAFDVHINRMPIGGTIARVAYRPGRFINATLDKASEDNERNSVLIATVEGMNIAVVQIAGLIARRICCWIKEGQQLETGERFGMIRFGSRTDVYLPEGIAPLVAPGQRCIAGETVIADIRAQEPAREAELR